VKVILELGILGGDWLLMMPVEMSSKAQHFQDLVAASSGARWPDRVADGEWGGGALGWRLPPQLVAGIFGIYPRVRHGLARQGDNLHGQNPQPRRTVGSA
jgi:hypothetical protein